jgi:branched-chain amino acid transport system ATP-binding protein
MAAVLEINDLHYRYGAIHALKGVSVVVNEGEIVTLIGANGAGKTTMLRCLSGLLNSNGLTGDIRFMGKSIQKMGAYKIAAMGLCQVLEGRHIFPRLTVEENLFIGAFQRRDVAEIKNDIKNIYKKFPRLEERKKQEGGTLSGGEQQMLAIARGLMSRPKLIMMDEPSLGLAPMIVKEIFKTIKEINKEGIPVLLVEQNCNMALQTANRGYVLETGEITLQDQCDNLICNEQVKKSYLGG